MTYPARGYVDRHPITFLTGVCPVRKRSFRGETRLVRTDKRRCNTGEKMGRWSGNGDSCSGEGVSKSEGRDCVG